MSGRRNTNLYGNRIVTVAGVPVPDRHPVMLMLALLGFSPARPSAFRMVAKTESCDTPGSATTAMRAPPRAASVITWEIFQARPNSNTPITSIRSSASAPPTRAIMRNAPIRRTGPMKPPTATSNLTSPPPSMPSVNGGSESSSANPAPSTPSTSAVTPSTPRNTSAAPSPATVNQFGIRRQRRSNHTPRPSSVVSVALAITDLVQWSDALALRGAGAGSTVRPWLGSLRLEDRRYYFGTYGVVGAACSESATALYTSPVRFLMKTRTAIRPIATSAIISAYSTMPCPESLLQSTFKRSFIDSSLARGLSEDKGAPDLTGADPGT